MLNTNIGKLILITINGDCYDRMKKPRFSIRYLGFFVSTKEKARFEKIRG
jgi:hypothetical protein